MIACRIQAPRRKTWEIWSRAVTSGRQKVDTQGVVPGEESQSLLCTIRAGRQSINEAASILFIVYNARDGSTELLWLGTTFHESTLCLPDVTTHDQISQAFSLCICILQAIKDWRWEQPRLGSGYLQLNT